MLVPVTMGSVRLWDGGDSGGLRVLGGFGAGISVALWILWCDSRQDTPGPVSCVEHSR